MGEEQVAVVRGDLAPVHTVQIPDPSCAGTMDTVTVSNQQHYLNEDSLLVDLQYSQIMEEDGFTDEKQTGSCSTLGEETGSCSTLGEETRDSSPEMDTLAGNFQPSTPLLTHKLRSCSQLTLPLPLSTSTGLVVGSSGFMENKSETNSLFLPMCRICHMVDESPDLLISPCRCSGTLQFIHHTCLMRWLEISAKKSRRPPKCELCHYQYHRHKKFKLHHWRMPRISRQDKILHIVFVINLVIMITCAIATVMCFLSDKGQVTKFPRDKVDLTTEEIVTLSCGVLFFVSFFVAMSVQIKAKHTIYQLMIKFVMQNMEWEIDEYDKSKDSLYFKATPDYV